MKLRVYRLEKRNYGYVGEVDFRRDWVAPHRVVSFILRRALRVLRVKKKERGLSVWLLIGETRHLIEVDVDAGPTGAETEKLLKTIYDELTSHTRPLRLVTPQNPRA